MSHPGSPRTAESPGCPTEDPGPREPRAAMEQTLPVPVHRSNVRPLLTAPHESGPSDARSSWPPLPIRAAGGPAAPRARAPASGSGRSGCSSSGRGLVLAVRRRRGRLHLLQPRPALGGGAAQLPAAPGDQGDVRGRLALRGVLQGAPHAGAHRGAPARTCATPFLAAEDADFYKHEGLDFFGMMRARPQEPHPRQPQVRRLHDHPAGRAGTCCSRPSAASARKIREWILTPRMEKALTKDQILNLYVNQIYFGHHRYGMEEAALYYFGKHAKDLSIGEAAVLAGTPQQPEPHQPGHQHRPAKGRQRYVLGQMAQHGFLARSSDSRSWRSPSCSAPRPPPPVGAVLRRGDPPDARRPLRRAGGARGRPARGHRHGTRSSRPWPTTRCARAWRRWTGARATGARWRRSTRERFERARGADRPRASRRPADGRRTGVRGGPRPAGRQPPSAEQPPSRDEDEERGGAAARLERRGARPPPSAGRGAGARRAARAR